MYNINEINVESFYQGMVELDGCGAFNEDQNEDLQDEFYI